MANRRLFVKARALGLWTLFLLVLSVFLMTFSWRLSLIHQTGSAISVVEGPVRYIEHLPGDVIRWMRDSWQSHTALIAENKQLKEDLRIANFKLENTDAITMENTRLRALFKSASAVTDKITFARLLTDSRNDINQTLIIRPELKAYEGQAILDDKGLVGQVMESGPLSTRVLLITDRRSAVPVVDARSGIRTIANGVGNLNVLYLAGVVQTADIQEGDVMLTSGLAQHFPAGYPVGIVSKVTHNHTEEFAEIVVAPYAHFDTDMYFAQVWPKQETVPIIHLNPVQSEEGNDIS